MTSCAPIPQGAIWDELHLPDGNIWDTDILEEVARILNEAGYEINDIPAT